MNYEKMTLVELHQYTIKRLEGHEDFRGRFSLFLDEIECTLLRCYSTPEMSNNIKFITVSIIDSFYAVDVYELKYLDDDSSGALYYVDKDSDSDIPRYVIFTSIDILVKYINQLYDGSLYLKLPSRFRGTLIDLLYNLNHLLDYYDIFDMLINLNYKIYNLNSFHVGMAILLYDTTINEFIPSFISNIDKNSRTFTIVINDKPTLVNYYETELCYGYMEVNQFVIFLKILGIARYMTFNYNPYVLFSPINSKFTKLLNKFNELNLCRI